MSASNSKSIMTLLERTEKELASPASMVDRSRDIHHKMIEQWQRQKAELKATSEAKLQQKSEQALDQKQSLNVQRQKLIEQIDNIDNEISSIDLELSVHTDTIMEQLTSGTASIDTLIDASRAALSVLAKDVSDSPAKPAKAAKTVKPSTAAKMAS